MSNEDIERILNYTTTMKSGTPYLEIVELIDEYKNQQKEIDFYRKNNYILAENDDGVVVGIQYCPENFISKNKIREKIKHYNNELEHIKNGEEFENEKPMYYWGKVALENLLEEN